MAAVTTVLDVPIRFDVGDTVTHAPMIDVVVAGQRTRCILDTGSTDHVFTVELAQAAGLPYAPGEPGTDHAGDLVESWVLGDIGIEIDEVGLGLHDTVAITGPAVFEGWGIGGFLSPQHLHPDAHVVIDLVAERFILLEGDDRAVEPWLRARSPDLTLLELERDLTEATPVVQAAIDPFPPVATMLNTGGRGTEFAVSAVPGLVGSASDDTGKGIGGGAVRGTMVADQVLVIDGARFPVPRLLLRDKIDTMQGLVGQDVLRGTILVVCGDRGQPVRWQVPSG